MVSLDTETPGSSREFHSEDADHGTGTRNHSVLCFYFEIYYQYLTDKTCFHVTPECLIDVAAAMVIDLYHSFTSFFKFVVPHYILLRNNLSTKTFRGHLFDIELTPHLYEYGFIENG